MFPVARPEIAAQRWKPGITVLNGCPHSEVQIAYQGVRLLGESGMAGMERKADVAVEWCCATTTLCCET